MLLDLREDVAAGYFCSFEFDVLRRLDRSELVVRHKVVVNTSVVLPQLLLKHPHLVYLVLDHVVSLLRPLLLIKLHLFLIAYVLQYCLSNLQHILDQVRFRHQLQGMLLLLGVTAATASILRRTGGSARTRRGARGGCLGQRSGEVFVQEWLEDARE